MDLVIPALGLAGGAALGAALGGAAALGLKLVGGRQAAATAGVGVLGALGGLVLVGGAPMQALASLPGMAALGGVQGGEQRVQATLQRYYPADYAQVVRRVGQGGTQRQQLARVDELGVAIMQRQFRLASPRNAVALAQLTRDQQRVLAAKNPQLCWRLLMDPRSTSQPEMLAAEPEDLQARELALTADILEQTATHPYAFTTGPDAARRLRVWAMDAMGGLSDEDKATLRAGRRSNPTDEQARAVCNVGASLMDMIAKASPEDAAEVMKTVSEQGFNRLR